MSAIKNSGILLVLFLCCGWPMLSIAIYEGIKHLIKTRDWTNVQWSELWSKE